MTASSPLNETQDVNTQLNKKKEGDAPPPFTFSKIAYYCKECKKLVECTEKKPMKYACKECKKSSIAFGTERSLKNFYRIKEEEKKDT